jgi:hypothetical protein
MSDEVSSDLVDLRHGDRFVLAETVTGTFGALEVTLLNVSIAGAQVSHIGALRIGTLAKLTFKRGEASATVHARVMWSHATANARGVRYTSGLKLEQPDVHFATAINALYKGGVVRRDTDSLQIKRQRIAEREAAKKAKIRNIPTSEPPPV